jgi:hypothetical protein
MVNDGAVTGHIAQLSEAPAAFRTNKRLLSGVLPHVVLKTRRIDGSVTADPAKMDDRAGQFQTPAPNAASDWIPFQD